MISKEKIKQLVSVIFFSNFLYLAFLSPFNLAAQVTKASYRGTVTDVDNSPLAGAEVTISNEKSGFSKSVSTNEDGAFRFVGLKVGGPYVVTATLDSFEKTSITVNSLAAGNNPPGQIYLQKASVEKIEVTGARVVGSGNGSTYDISDIKGTPNAGRDIKTLVQKSADIYLEGERLYIAGNSERSNSITVDGMRQDDDFGLNGSGYATSRSPISLEAIEEITVNQSPYDVRYGNFIGGNINVVTKSGTNDYTGSVFYRKGSHLWEGKKTKDQDVSSDFDSNTYGFTLGGPIVEDEAHFFIAVEGLSEITPRSVGTNDSGAINTVSNVSSADVAEVQQISQDVYGFNAGKANQNVKETDLKLLAKFDWDINYDHHLEAKFQSTKGSEDNASYYYDDTLPLTSNWYRSTSSIYTSTLRLLSDWSDAFSTKMEISHKKVKTNQDPLEGNGFMEASIANSTDGEIVIGPDRYRHANRLDTEVVSAGVEGNYLEGLHSITAGLSLERTAVYNLFAPYSNGSASYDSIEDFRNQTPSYIRYQNATSNNSADRAASFGIGTTTLYVQDEYTFPADVVATAGLRFQGYSSKGKIEYNENFEARHGFSNTSDLDGKNLFLPRLGLTYQPDNRLSVAGGLGIYGGGSPNVWISNNYANDGVTVGESRYYGSEDGEQIIFDGRNVPQILKDGLQDSIGDSSSVDAMDPDFEIPRSLKVGTTVNYQFDIPGFLDNINVKAGYNYSKVQQGLLWKDLRRNHPGFEGNQPTTTAPDGRAIYGDDFDPDRGYDMLLTNTDKGFSHNLTLGLSKAFDSGFSFSTSYNWQKVREVNPGNSSQASSNYARVAVGLDPNNPDLSRSTYEREHRFVLETSYSKSFYENLVTSVSLFMERRSGQPFSYTFGGDDDALASLYGESSTFSYRERMLFYVPKGDGTDVEYGEGIDEASLNAFLDRTGLSKYRGQIAPRNEFFSDWINNVNMRLSQDLPGYKDGHYASIVLDIQNLPNLLNSKWGQQKSVPFDYMVNAVDVDYNAATGKYVYSNLMDEDDDGQNINVSESIWKMAVSVYYNF